MPQDDGKKVGKGGRKTPCARAIFGAVYFFSGKCFSFLLRPQKLFPILNGRTGEMDEREGNEHHAAAEKRTG